MNVGRPLASSALIALCVSSYSFAAQTDAVYTKEQAARGATVYGARCAECHGAKLEGIAGPALSGATFLKKWNGQTADDLHYIAESQMPLDAPGALKASEYLDITAFILSKNAFEAGETPLTAAKLKSITFRSKHS